MDKSQLRTFSGGSGGGGGPGGGVGRAPGEYSQIGGSDSDDSHSSISPLDDTEGIPSIIYTSDDSADVARSDSTCVDSEAMGYIGHNVQIHDDEEASSQRLLLDSECSSPQPSPQPNPCFTLAHPLATMTFASGSESDFGLADDIGLQKDSLHHLGTHHEGCSFERSTSLSSTSSGSSPEAQLPLLTEYQPLSDFTHYSGMEYEPLEEHSIPAKKMHDPLDLFVDVTDIPKTIQPFLGRCVVGSGVHISAQYKDAFYVSWNWHRIRQTCVLLNASVLISLLCVGVGLLLQMPRGSECDPVHAWWQGSVMYEVYVPSFHDSDGDGVGDLPGLASKLNYIQKLGVKGVRINSILQAADHLNSYTPVTNYTDVDPLLGTLEDLKALASDMHHRGMYLLMDIPLTASSDEKGITLEGVYPVLKYWLGNGIDGFHFPDITEYASDPGLVEAVHQWRNILDHFSSGLEHKVMMAPVALLDTLKAAKFPHLDHLLHQLDLIDVSVKLTGPAEAISESLNSATAWDSHASLPWINWNMGGVGKERVAALTDLNPLGRSLVLLFFPGTVTLYYGDELGFSNVSQDNGWSSIMAWNSDAHAGFSSAKPWRSLSTGWEEQNVESQNDSISVLSTMISARQQKVPIYINGIFDYKGDYHPTKSANYKVRHASADLLIMDRFYPRRNKCALVANLGTEVINKDISHYYFGGSVLASSHGQTGYVTFRNISLQPGEALACILDL